MRGGRSVSPLSSSCRTSSSENGGLLICATCCWVYGTRDAVRRPLNSIVTAPNNSRASPVGSGTLDERGVGRASGKDDHC